MDGAVTRPLEPVASLSVAATGAGNPMAGKDEVVRSDVLIVRVEVAVVERFEGVVKSVGFVLVKKVGEARETEEVSRRETEDETGILYGEGASELSRECAIADARLGPRVGVIARVGRERRTSETC